MTICTNGEPKGFFPGQINQLFSKEDAVIEALVTKDRPSLEAKWPGTEPSDWGYLGRWTRVGDTKPDACWGLYKHGAEVRAVNTRD